jgi:hypothetical protein
MLHVGLTRTVPERTEDFPSREALLATLDGGREPGSVDRDIVGAIQRVRYLIDLATVAELATPAPFPFQYPGCTVQNQLDRIARGLRRLRDLVEQGIERQCGEARHAMLEAVLAETRVLTDRVYGVPDCIADMKGCNPERVDVRQLLVALRIRAMRLRVPLVEVGSVRRPVEAGRLVA